MTHGFHAMRTGSTRAPAPSARTATSVTSMQGAPPRRRATTAIPAIGGALTASDADVEAAAALPSSR